MSLRTLLLAVFMTCLAHAVPPPVERPDAPVCDIVAAINLARREAVKLDAGYYCDSASYSEASLASGPSVFDRGHWRITFCIPKDKIKAGGFRDILIFVSADGKSVRLIKDPSEALYQVRMEKKTEGHSTITDMTRADAVCAVEEL